MGYNSYEVRGSEVYLYISDDFDEYGLPMFEIRGSEVYPTTLTTGMTTAYQPLKSATGTPIPPPSTTTTTLGSKSAKTTANTTQLLAMPTHRSVTWQLSLQ